MSPAQITVNGFEFCAVHGDEYCHLCYVDHRLANNSKVEDELSNLEDVFEIGLEERQPINVYAYGATTSLSKGNAYECIVHGVVDCSQCFNWVKLIQREAREAVELGSWLERRRGSVDQLLAGLARA